MLQEKLIIERITEKRKDAFRDTLYRFLVEIDSDFVPPLSGRSSTSQLDFSEPKPPGHTFPYLEGLLRQEIITAYIGNSLTGFLSYIEDFEDISLGLPRSNYITTIAVSRAFRGKGIGKLLYSEALKDNRTFTTRTWTRDDAQISTLEKFGFKPLKVIENHRGPGVHTIYYIK